VKEINVCVPVLKRYDLLVQLVNSLMDSDVKPTSLTVMNNGEGRVHLPPDLGFRLEILRPGHPKGVAESWNWFIEHVREERVIVNDDIVFAPDSIGKLVAAEGDLIFAEGCGFSCYVLRDSCVEKIGLFDELISPGYGYYEDDDYLQRVDGRGTKSPRASLVNVDCGVVHMRSQTLAVSTPEEVNEHHRKFKIAQANYMQKWGLTTI
jgi:hypothetical protein